MRYPVKVYDVPPPREIDGRLIQQKPKLMREFDIYAGNLEKCRRKIKEKVDKQENMFKGKELRTVSFGPDSNPLGVMVFAYVQTRRQRRDITRSAKDLGM